MKDMLHLSRKTLKIKRHVDLFSTLQSSETISNQLASSSGKVTLLTEQMVTALQATDGRRSLARAPGEVSHRVPETDGTPSK